LIDRWVYSVNRHALSAREPVNLDKCKKVAIGVTNRACGSNHLANGHSGTARVARSENLSAP